MNDIPVVHHNIGRELSAWPIRSARRPMRPLHAIANREWFEASFEAAGGGRPHTAGLLIYVHDELWTGV